MHVLFIHGAFPAQFGRLALELTKRYGWKCSFLVESLSSCPEPSREMLERLELRPIPVSAEFKANPELPWPQNYARSLELCQAVHDAARSFSAGRPDLVVGYSASGPPTLFLPEVFDSPIINYCEYYFAKSHRDISYRVDLPPAEPAHFYPRCINAITLVTLQACDAGYAPTHWQKQAFPARFHHKIEVHFDGLDTELYRPGPKPAAVAGVPVPRDTKVVTFVARGLESMRGFDVFMKVTQRIARERSDVLFVVVGGDRIYYGWDALHTGQKSFKAWVLSQGDYDLSRYLFLDLVPHDRLADVFVRSDLHLYLTVPFVLSWSCFNALACGCVVLASDVPPVREVIEPGVHGLTESFFDVDGLAETSLKVLADPAAYQPLGAAARARVEERYSLEVAVPDLKDYFERVAARGVSR